ncbi:hypothetical protein J4444_03200 [Candidatus Woesearchaeota archaeon]|nr:hypothetical protein [Candidatus Woesearchaeota archaeon]
MDLDLIALETLIGCGVGLSRGTKWDREVRFRSELETLAQELTGKVVPPEEKSRKERLLQLHKTGYDIRNSLAYGVAAQIAYLIFNDDKGFHFSGESMAAFAASYVAVSAASKFAQYVSMKQRHNKKLSAEDENIIHNQRDALTQAARDGKDLDGYVSELMGSLERVAKKYRNPRQISQITQACLNPGINIGMYKKIKLFLESDCSGIGVVEFAKDQIYENGEAIIVHERAVYLLHLHTKSSVSGGTPIGFIGKMEQLSSDCSVYGLTKLVEERRGEKELYLVHSPEPTPLEVKAQVAILHYAQASSLRINAEEAKRKGELS